MEDSTRVDLQQLLTLPYFKINEREKIRRIEEDLSTDSNNKIMGTSITCDPDSGAVYVPARVELSRIVLDQQDLNIAEGKPDNVIWLGFSGLTKATQVISRYLSPEVVINTVLDVHSICEEELPTKKAPKREINYTQIKSNLRSRLSGDNKSPTLGALLMEIELEAVLLLQKLVNLDKLKDHPHGCKIYSHELVRAQLNPIYFRANPFKRLVNRLIKSLGTFEELDQLMGEYLDLVYTQIEKAAIFYEEFLPRLEEPSPEQTELDLDVSSP